MRGNQDAMGFWLASSSCLAAGRVGHFPPVTANAGKETSSREHSNDRGVNLIRSGAEPVRRGPSIAAPPLPLTLESVLLRLASMCLKNERLSLVSNAATAAA